MYTRNKIARKDTKKSAKPRTFAGIYRAFMGIFCRMSAKLTI